MWFLSGHYCVIPFRSIHSPEIERTYNIDDNDNHYYETEMDSYQPIQPVNHDHGVCTFPVTRVCSGLNSHILQVRHILKCHTHRVPLFEKFELLLEKNFNYLF